MVSGSPDARAARQHAEAAARAGYGRLLALLAADDHDLAGAEDALADAFERALRIWPERGVPGNPDGWLLTVARNRRRDRWRSSAVRTSLPLDDAIDEVPAAGSPGRDRRLELLLVCAYDEIPPPVRTPLMLNTVLGYPAKEIGRAFSMPTATMASRLVRAKKRITAERIPFAVPDDHEIPDRLAPVLEALYAAFSIEWPEVPRLRYALILGLAEVVTELVPTSAEAHGLAALLCLSSARLPARLDAEGRYVPLPDQDPHLWDHDLIERGHVHLRTAHRLGELGRFQLEAAIAALHGARPVRAGTTTDWELLRRLHLALQREAPSLGGHVALAAVMAEIDGPAAGLAHLDAISEPADRFQPAWSARAHLLDRLGRYAEAVTAYERAIDLSTDPTERGHLQGLRDLAAEHAASH